MQPAGLGSLRVVGWERAWPGRCVSMQGLKQRAHLEGQLPRDAVWGWFWCPPGAWMRLGLGAPSSFMPLAHIPQDLPHSPTNGGCPMAKCSHGDLHLLHLPPCSVCFPSLEVSWDGEGALPSAAALPRPLAPAVQWVFKSLSLCDSTSPTCSPLVINQRLFPSSPSPPPKGCYCSAVA